MDKTITIEQIQATKTYQSLSLIQKSFITKRNNRQIISNALIVFSNLKQIPANISRYNLEIIQELIRLEEEKKQKEENSKDQTFIWERENKTN